MVMGANASVKRVLLELFAVLNWTELFIRIIDGEEILLDISDSTDVIAAYELKEHRCKCRAAVVALLDTLSEDNRKLCYLAKDGVSNVKIGRELGITEGYRLQTNQKAP